MLRGRSRWPGPAADLPELWAPCPRAASPSGKGLGLLELHPRFASFPPPARCPSRATEAPQLEAPSDRCPATPLCLFAGAGQLATTKHVLDGQRPAGLAATTWGAPDQPSQGLHAGYSAVGPGYAVVDAARVAGDQPPDEAADGGYAAARQRHRQPADRCGAATAGHRLGRAEALPRSAAITAGSALRPWGAPL